MNKLTVVTYESKTVGCSMTGSLKFPKYFSWSFLVEKRDRGFMSDYQMMPPPDI